MDWETKKGGRPLVQCPISDPSRRPSLPRFGSPRLRKREKRLIRMSIRREKERGEAARIEIFKERKGAPSIRLKWLSPFVSHLKMAEREKRAPSRRAFSLLVLGFGLRIKDFFFLIKNSSNRGEQAKTNEKKAARLPVRRSFVLPTRHSARVLSTPTNECVCARNEFAAIPLGMGCAASFSLAHCIRCVDKHCSCAQLFYIVSSFLLCFSPPYWLRAEGLAPDFFFSARR